MEVYYPELLNRKKAMTLFGLSRKMIEKLAKDGIVRTYVTNGGHRRYFRDDLIKYFNEKL
jgi:predicted site-specific integrase-resolvase